ncbi:MAG: DUF3572 domain-containing protein [Mesorhizobium sp.]|nr:DUF3572 domain-containing protein [Mesorhizobium sp.]MCO5164457.1 DUF3572 domain-containing protein [Mesorhizobium sp.]
MLRTSKTGGEREAAEALAIRALGFIASDAVLLPRFLSITGIEAKDIRAVAGQPGFLAGVLQFLLAHEPTLLQFAEAAQIDAAEVARACRALPFGDDMHERSS